MDPASGLLWAAGAQGLQELADQAGVGSASLTAMMERALSDPDFYEQQFGILKTDPDATIKALFGVACADRQLLPDERIVIRHFADQLGMSEEHFDTLLEAAQKRADEG